MDIEEYNGTRYLTLCGTDKYDTIYNRNRCLIGLKSGITYFFSLFCKNQSLFSWFFTYRKNVDLA